MAEHTPGPKSWPKSQVQAVNGAAPKTWDEYRRGCAMTFHGGHESHEAVAFTHGMETVFNLLDAEFPPAEVCQAAPETARQRDELLEALRALLDRHLDCIEREPNEEQDYEVFEAQEAIANAKGAP